MRKVVRPQFLNTTPVAGSMREMFLIAAPMVISQGAETVMIFTDRIFMSRLAPELMSATMAGGLSVFMITTFFIGLTGYGNALVAQYYGAGQRTRCSLVVTQTVIVALIGFPVVLALSPLVHILFDASGIEAPQLGPQKSYFNILIYSSFAALLRNCLSGFFSGIGRTAVIMIAALVSALVNVVLNYALIFGKLGMPAMGIQGAAIGTIIAGIAGLAVLFVWYLRYRSDVHWGIAGSLRFDSAVMGRLVRYGWPAGLELFSNLIAFNFMILVFHGHSLVTAAAATIVFNFDLVSFVPLIGIQIGVTSLVGRSMGRGDPDTAQRATFAGLKLGWIYSGAILMLFLSFPGELVELFRPVHHSDIFEQARPLAVFMLRVAALYVMTDTMFAVLSGALRGAGDTVWAMLITGTLHWALVPILYGTLNVLKLSARIGWVTLVCVFISFSAAIIWRYARGPWRTLRVVDGDALPGSD